MDITDPKIQEDGVKLVSVEDWLSRWLVEVVQAERSGGTYDRYNDIVQRQLNPRIGDIPLAELLALHIRSMEINDGTEMIPENEAGPVLVREWLDQWLAEVVQAERSGGTYDRYNDIVQRQLNPRIGDILLKELSARDIRALERALISDGLTRRTVGLVHSVISGACRYAVQSEILDKNPASVFSAPRPEAMEVETPDVEQVKALLALAKAEGHYLFAYLRLNAYTAMRRGESLALRWANTHLDKGYVRVVESAVKERGKGMVVKAPKTKRGVRNIDLDDGTVEVLREHRERQEMTGITAQTNLVFPGRKGRLMKPTTLDRDLKALAKRAGLPSFNLHQLRHFHASVSLRLNPGDLVTVSRRLGHSSVSMTMDIYGHVLAGWQRDVADAFAQEMESD